MQPNSSVLFSYDSDSRFSVTLRSWIVVLVASMFFFYEFIQMNMMDAISQSIINSFHINAQKLGDMSSYYFLANVVFLFLAGSLLDRFSTRRIILYSFGICVIGTALFGIATNLLWITVCRFLTGVGSAFCFLSVLRLASRWFPARKMALVTGVIVTIAMTGGIVSQTPFTVLVTEFGWRHTLYLDAAFGFMTWIIIYLTVHDFPASQQDTHEIEQRKLYQIGYWQSFRKAFLRKQNWFGGIYVSCINLPINVLGGLWGIMYLTTTYHFTKIHASWVTTMLFAGTILGSPLVGAFSDLIAKRKPPMILGAFVSIVLIMIVIWAPHLSFMDLLVLFFLIGLASSSQIIGYPLVAESSERIVTAMSVSIVNITTIGGIGIIQRVYGYLMQTHAEGRVHHATTNYVASDFHWAMCIFLVGCIISLLMSILVKETYCVQKEG